VSTLFEDAQEEMHDTNQSDEGEQLYRQFLAGDESAFERLVEIYEDDLFRFINRMLRDNYEAKRLTVETFAQLIVNKKKFQGGSSFKTYLFAIGRNTSATYLKERMRENHMSFEEVIDFLVDDAEPLESLVEQEESRQMLRDTMPELKDEYQTVLQLLYFNDMSYAQAAKAMRKSEKQIKNLAYSAKAALRIALEAKGFS